jgi:hypothetical protein
MGNVDNPGVVPDMWEVQATARTLSRRNSWQSLAFPHLAAEFHFTPELSVLTRHDLIALG